MQEMHIYGVSFDLVGKQPIVLLKTAEGNRFLPIWIGHPEAAAILMKLQSATTPRPMTHDLVTDMLDQLGAQVTRITVTELRENTFYAQITVQQDGSEIDVDSRPSDAIALAIRADAPIFAAEVRSEGDYGPAAERSMAAKRADYFRAGTLVVWDVDVLRDMVVRVYRADNPQNPTVYGRGEVAEAEQALPGWTMPVDDLFQ